MLFKPSSPGAMRLVRPADAGYATAIDPATTTGLPACAPGLRLAPVVDPVDISDPLELAYLLSPSLGAPKAKPYVVIVDGRINYVAVDLSPIDPAPLPAVDDHANYGFGAFTPASAGAPAGFAPSAAGFPGATIPLVAFPRWL